jgi:CubicO group peptidase (beta-lactamase class C family)
MDEVNDAVAEGCDPQRDAQGAIVAWRKNMYSFPPLGSPDSGAHVTASDLERFLRQLKAGALVSAPFVQAFLTPQVRHEVGKTWTQMYGYGLQFAVDGRGRVLFAEKEGINAGVSAVMRYYPDADITVVLLANSQRGAWEPRRAIHRLLVRGEKLPMGGAEPAAERRWDVDAWAGG